MSHSIRRYKTDISERSPATHSDESQDSQSTTPTSLFSSPSPSLRQATDLYSKPEYDISPCTTFCARSSTETYSSTVESFEELCEEPDTYDPEYEVPEYREPVDHDLRPSNPSDFADFFPTMNRLCIRHDDTTHDGNMNLRVDTERKRGTIQLFHLKMNDLKKREFSLRRYERSSGREVCHSARKFTTPSSEKRPAITRSVSNAFASIVKPEFKRASSGFSTHSSNSTKKPIKRQDSGYGSNSDDEEDYNEDENPYFPSPSKAKSTIQIPSNTTKLEFSNYAQVLVKRRGAKSSKRYEFEYWGHKYTWKRVVKKDGEGKEVSYHLYQGDNGYAIAHIVPELRSRSQVREEERNGGWVKPCSMWISDKSVLEAVTDVADVIIATGLIALVDDSIKSHFHPSHSTVRPSISRTHTLPIPKFGVDMEYVGPRALVEHMFKRRNSGASAKEREQRPSPLRAHAVTVY